MQLTEELRKLADLRAAGSLSEDEFVAAKRQLLSSTAPSRVPEPPTPAGVEPAATPLLPEAKRYWSSRWSAGNRFFRDSLTLASDGIRFRKGAWFGSSEEHIHYRAIASLRVHHGTFLATISIETSGGSQPIVINGLWKSEARDIQNTIAACQR